MVLVLESDYSLLKYKYAFHHRKLIFLFFSHFQFTLRVLALSSLKQPLQYFAIEFIQLYEIYKQSMNESVYILPIINLYYVE